MRTFGHSYGPRGVDRAAAEDDRGQGDVGPAVHHHLDVLGHQPAVTGDPGSVPDPRRMALGGGTDVLVAVVDHAYRLAHPLGQQGGMEGDDRGVLLLAAESAARFGLDDHRLGIGQVQRPLQRPVDVIRALHRAVDLDPAVGAGDRDHGLVLDVQLLLVADPVLALDHDLGRVKAGLHVALDELEVGELALGEQRIEDGRQPLGAERDVALGDAQQLAVGRGQQADRLGLVLDFPAQRDEDRLVVLDEADHVVARDVVGGDHHHLGPVEVRVQVDAPQPGMGLGGADGGPVPRAGKDEVVGVLGGAGELLRTLTAKRERGPRAARRNGAPGSRGAVSRSGPACSRPHGIQSRSSRARGEGHGRAAPRCGGHRPPPRPR